MTELTDDTLARLNYLIAAECARYPIICDRCLLKVKQGDTTVYLCRHPDEFYKDIIIALGVEDQFSIRQMIPISDDDLAAVFKENDND